MVHAPAVNFISKSTAYIGIVVKSGAGETQPSGTLVWRETERKREREKGREGDCEREREREREIVSEKERERERKRKR